MAQCNDRLGNRKLINRTEYIRLIQQALCKLGHNDVAIKLEEATGIQMQPAQAAELRERVLSGDWASALTLLPQLTASADALRDAQFLVLQQKYVEALEAQDFKLALTTLRSELAMLNVHQQQLHQLAGLLMCPEDVVIKGLGGPGGRESLLVALTHKLPPDIMIPNGRLEELVEQALLAQVASCPYHNPAVNECLSLLSDYHVGPEALPSVCVAVGKQHKDEVWSVAFSHSGEMLATASKDKTAIVWRVSPGGTPRPHFTLTGHSAPIDILLWSPDDAFLITCSDESVWLWDMSNGLLKHHTRRHNTITSCVWLPAGDRFLSTTSTDRSITVHNTTGQEVESWRRPYRIQDMAISHNGVMLAIISAEKIIYLMRLSDSREVMLTEAGPFVSVAWSRCDRYLAVTTMQHAVHLWDLEGTTAPYPSAQDGGVDPMDEIPCEALRELRHVSDMPGREPLPIDLRSGFGGAQDTFIVHGSEDCQVYIWHRDSGTLLMQLSAHTATVNSVAWNAARPYMLASVSDDATLRMWLSQAALDAGVRAEEAQESTPQANGVAYANGHV